ncbi:hypothetical protein QQS21_006119 [Conoideocrella luteorostrata]|uniref:Uncharacterized protein n=1 Tax=Conoideocrella luteorostrata TaxID=1105319 RepID=A0AAJ0FYA9_9HYPO|nr:hypothetical protein QQS21_006119 [Conoideocrella luteorostrata]
MSAFAGAQGYENLSSAKQQERSTAGLLDKGLVRNPSATPAHLSRVLHIPAHRNSEFHIRVYNVTSEYKHAIGYAPMGGSDIIGDALMGSRLFMTRLGTMKKPPMSLEDNEAQYAANAHVNANEVVVALRSLPEGSQGQNAVM